MKRKAKMVYFRQLVTTSKDSKQVWKAINILTNNKMSKNNQPIAKVSPNKLNQHFSNIAQNIGIVDKSNQNDLLPLKTFLQTKKIRSIASLPAMTVIDVMKSLRQLKQSATRDLDGIDGRILKLSAPIIADTLTYIYNLCIDKKYFPLQFKQAKVIPIYKSGDPETPSNYRPISILSLLSKPLEKHINKHLLTHLEENNLLHQDQSGSRANHSCHTALTQLKKNVTVI